MNERGQGPIEANEPMTDEQADTAFGAAVGAVTLATTVEGVAAKEEKAVAAAEAAKTVTTKDDQNKKPVKEEKQEPAKVEPVKTSKDLAAEEAKKINDENNRQANEAEAKRKADEDAKKMALPKAQSPLDLNATKAMLTESLKGVKLGNVEGLEAFEKEYGADITTAMIAVADALARRYSSEAVTPLAQAEQNRQAEAATNALMTSLETEYGHTDIKEIRNEPKFWTFVDGLDKPIRDAVNNGNAKVINFVVNAYKEEAGLPTAKSGGKDKTVVVSEQREKRKETDDLHRHTSRSRERAPSISGAEVETEEDAQKVFDEATKQAGK